MQILKTLLCFLVVTAGFVVVAAVPLEAQWCSSLGIPGQRDLSFGATGVVRGSRIIEGRYTSIRAHDSARTGDGGIVVLGYAGIGSNPLPSSPQSASVVFLDKIRNNGTPDPQFGQNGRLVLSLSFPVPGNIITVWNEMEGNNLKIQADGKIVFALPVKIQYSSADGLKFEYRVAVIRLLSNGAVDPTFGNQGVVFLNPDATSNFSPVLSTQFDVVQLSNGTFRYLVGAGFIHGQGYQSSAIMTLDASGVLDTTFGSQGRVVLSSEVNLGVLQRDIKFQPDQKVVVLIRDPGDANANLRLFRLLPNGQFDSSFGNEGAAQLPMQFNPATFVEARALAVQSDGKLIVTGSLAPVDPAPPYNDYFTVRFTEHGQIDPNFGDGFLNPYDSGSFNDGTDVAIAPNGDVLVVGTAFTCERPNCAGPSKTALLNYDSAGHLRSDFASGGVLLISSNGNFSRPTRTLTVGDAGTVYTVADDIADENGSTTNTGYAIERTIVTACVPPGSSSSSASLSSASSSSSSSVSSSASSSSASSLSSSSASTSSSSSSQSSSQSSSGSSSSSAGSSSSSSTGSSSSGSSSSSSSSSASSSSSSSASSGSSESSSSSSAARSSNSSSSTSDARCAVDSDLDGTSDCADLCPGDPSKSIPGGCGCGIPDVDNNVDGELDCQQLGSRVCDRDHDGDGAPDCADGCPASAARTQIGICRCAPEIDSNGNGTIDCIDSLLLPAPGRAKISLSGDKIVIQAKRIKNARTYEFYYLVRDSRGKGTSAASKVKVRVSNRPIIRLSGRGITRIEVAYAVTFTSGQKSHTSELANRKISLRRKP